MLYNDTIDLSERIDVAKINNSIMLKSKTGVTSYELRVQIHELRVQIYKFRVQIHELRVQIHELED